MNNPAVTRYPADVIAEAVKSVPTPFFLYEESMIRQNCRLLKDAFGPLFPGFAPLFAVKANPNPHVLEIIRDEGFSFDCSSTSEVELARQFDAFGMHTGNYVSEADLRAVLASKLLLNLDDISMLETVRRIGMPSFLSFRINPGIASATIQSNLLAGPDAKYGVPWEQAVEAYRRAKELGVSRFGIHMMTGSNVTTPEYFPAVTRKLLQVAGTVAREVDIEFGYLNIGGGFNVPYQPEEPTFDLRKIAQDIRKVFDEELSRSKIREPRLMIEPGRRVTCDAGFLIGKVHVIKRGYKTFVGIDANCSDMPRPSIYGAYHHISVLGKGPEQPQEVVNVVGTICENNDQFARDRSLPRIEVGDYIVIHNCGAHAYAMGHNYNGKTRSAEYLLDERGGLRQIRRAETVEDLFRTVIPRGNRGKISSRIAQTAPYAFAEVDKQVARLKAQGVHVLDFGVGDPREPTPAFIIEAMTKAVTAHAASGYPNYEGSPSFRAACAEYMHREFGVDLNPETEIVATVGSKEAVFHFPFGILEPGDIVLCPSPGYPPYKTGTRFAGGTPYFVPLREDMDFLIDFQSIPESICRRARILWTNYPNSPTGRVAPRAWLEELYAWARHYGIIVAADEGCYIDLYFKQRPSSILEIGRDGVIAFYSLSKRNNMTGYRIGFCAGDAGLVGALRKVKTNVDSGVPWFIQDAAAVALRDTTHVEYLRRGYFEKRSVMLAALGASGLPPCSSDATFYLWQRAPTGMSGLDLARRLLELGIVVTPGEWISDRTDDGANPGADHVRLALVASKDDVLEAQRRLAGVRFA